MVVLPFTNIGGDPEQDYFVDGVTESLTTDLSRISGSFVIAHNTAFTFKGKAVDVKQVGRELNVRYVLEGSVQRARNRLRVNVQLIDAETGSHLWAERFDKPVADLFDMQDEIVSRLANTLSAQLIAAEARRAERTLHPDAMDLNFRGRACLIRGGWQRQQNSGILEKPNCDRLPHWKTRDSKRILGTCQILIIELVNAARSMIAASTWRSRVRSAALNAPCAVQLSRIGTLLGFLDINSLPVRPGC